MYAIVSIQVDRYHQGASTSSMVLIMANQGGAATPTWAVAGVSEVPSLSQPVVRCVVAKVPVIRLRSTPPGQGRDTSHSNN